MSSRMCVFPFFGFDQVTVSGRELIGCRCLVQGRSDSWLSASLRLAAPESRLLAPPKYSPSSAG
jgi:hypothetical protein